LVAALNKQALGAFSGVRQISKRTKVRNCEVSSAWYAKMRCQKGIPK